VVKAAGEHFYLIGCAPLSSVEPARNQLTFISQSTIVTIQRFYCRPTYRSLHSLAEIFALSPVSDLRLGWQILAWSWTPWPPLSKKSSPRNTPSSPPSSRRTFFANHNEGAQKPRAKKRTQNTPQRHLEMQATIRPAYRAVLGPLMTFSKPLQPYVSPVSRSRRFQHAQRGSHISLQGTHPTGISEVRTTFSRIGVLPLHNRIFDWSFAIQLIFAFTKDQEERGAHARPSLSR